MTLHVPTPAGTETPAAASEPAGRTPDVFRLWLLSDLRVHEEAFVVPPPPADFDALVVAGGVRPGLAGAVRWLADAFGSACGSRPLILVPGPLEFEDGMPVADALAEGEAAAGGRGVTLLHDAGLRLGRDDRPGLHVLGATLWPAFAMDGDRAVEARGHGRHRWAACRHVRSARGVPFLPHDAVGAHARSRSYIEDALRAIWVRGGGYGGAAPVVGPVRGGDRAVVVTALPPLRACLPPGLARPLTDPWAPNWLASDLDAVFEGYGAPEAWAHGRVPHAIDMRVGRSRIVANPRGRGDPTNGFDAGRIIAV